MSDILDSYISKIDVGSFPKRINDSISRINSRKNRFIKLITIRFEILKIKLELKFDYMKLGKFISKKYDKEDVIDYSYQEKFFLLNHDIARKNRYIKKLKNNIKM